MDTRIGYPTQHLGSENTIENLTSPMYSTGIGLVLKGFQALNKQQAQNPPIETTNSEGLKDTTGGAKRGSFFEAIIQRGKLFLTEDDN